MSIDENIMPFINPSSRPVDTYAALERVFREVRDISGGASGPVPPRPARLLPHTAQSLLDAYWCRLGAVRWERGEGVGLVWD